MVASIPAEKSCRWIRCKCSSRHLPVERKPYRTNNINWFSWLLTLDCLMFVWPLLIATMNLMFARLIWLTNRRPAASTERIYPISFAPLDRSRSMIRKSVGKSCSIFVSLSLSASRAENCAGPVTLSDEKWRLFKQKSKKKKKRRDKKLEYIYIYIYIPSSKSSLTFSLDCYSAPAVTALHSQFNSRFHWSNWSIDWQLCIPSKLSVILFEGEKKGRRRRKKHLHRII